MTAPWSGSKCDKCGIVAGLDIVMAPNGWQYCRACAPTPETPRMTAGRIATYCPKCGGQVGGTGTNIFCTCQPEDLRAALAASQQEVERLRVREREALDAHADSFGALRDISLLTGLGGEVDEYSDVTKAVESALALAQNELLEKVKELALARRDGERLDTAQTLVLAADFSYHMEMADGTPVQESVLVLRIPKGVRINGDIRQFLDAASPPPETTEPSDENA